MFAIVRTGGKQYRVAAGDRITVDKIDGEAGARVQLGDILLAGEGDALKPTDGLHVAADIVAQGKGEKVVVFKKRRRHNYRRKNGHRQHHTVLEIVSVGTQQQQPVETAKTAEAPAPSEAVVAAAPVAAEPQE